MSDQLPVHTSRALADDPAWLMARVIPGLGWSGVALPETTILGCRLVPVVALDQAAHAARVATGDGPQFDHDTLTMWEWPEAGGCAPAPVARLVGEVFRAGGSSRRAVREAVRWRAFGPSAVLVAGSAPEEVTRWDCARRRRPGQRGPDQRRPRRRPDRWYGRWGVGSVELPAGDPALVVAAEPGRRASSRRRTADRWLEEVLYARSLDTGVLNTAKADDRAAQAG